MGKPEDDQTPTARSDADAELARQDKVAADQLNLSVSNLNTMAAELSLQGYGDAAVLLTRTVQQERGEAERYARQGELFHDASIKWGASALSLENQAKELGQSYVVAAAVREAEGGVVQPSQSETEQANLTPAEAAAEARIMAHNDKADTWVRAANNLGEQAIEAEEQARDIHPEAVAEVVAPEPASE